MNFDGTLKLPLILLVNLVADQATKLIKFITKRPPIIIYCLNYSQRVILKYVEQLL